MNNYTILSPKGARISWSEWSDFRLAIETEECQPKSKPPKKLIASVIKEFENFCENFHIDSSKYPWIEPHEIDDRWSRFDFMDDTNSSIAAVISVSGIISDSNGKIHQRVISF